MTNDNVDASFGSLVRRSAFGLCFLLAFASCGADAPANSATSSQPAAATVFEPAITSIVLEIDYATKAVPYTGDTTRLGDVWQVTNDNLGRIFQGAPKAITVPNTIAQMEELTDVSGSSFTSDALLAIATKHRNQPSSDATASFYIVFVDGYYDDGTGTQKDVLGVALGDTGVIGMFKPVIAATESAFAGISRYVEQATLVHELGHALGLVNRGLNMTAPHEDTAHPHHCTNTKCTMYWENEGSAWAITFARQVLTTGSLMIFGAECLADVDAASK